MNFILIDGSYYMFYRFYALNVWWKHQKKNVDNNGNNDDNNDKKKLHNNEIFVEKYKKTFISKISEIQTKLNINGHCTIIVGLDCPRKEIWRNKLYNEYKSNRDKKNHTIEKEFFKMVFDEQLFEKSIVDYIFKYPTLEADDCLAITTKYLLQNYNDAKIWIITSDMDYLQLASDNVQLYDLKFNNLIKKSFGSSDCDKFCKIVMGDKSDNIHGIFPRCGKKTALKYYNNKELFNKKLNQKIEYINNYDLNKNLVDFDEIPEDLVKSFIKKNLTKLSIQKSIINYYKN
jgi:5'-3' exonuclease